MRLIDADALKDAFWGACKNCLSEDDIADLIDDAPTIPAAEVGKWISVKDRPPEPETEVLICAERKYNGETYSITTTAIYEDGTISTEDSTWNWWDNDFDYDEENDKFYIPEGWWEYRHYNPDDVYNCAVDDKVTHWMPIPEPPKEGEK